MTKRLSVNHLLGIRQVTREDIQLILDTAVQFKEVINRPIKKVPSLRDITIANLFFENSTRTRVSFELAQKRLSADTVNFSASTSSVKKGETLIDTVNNISCRSILRPASLTRAMELTSTLRRLCWMRFLSANDWAIWKERKWPSSATFSTRAWRCRTFTCCGKWERK